MRIWYCIVTVHGQCRTVKAWQPLHLMSLMFFQLRLVMALKHGWFLNSLTPVELLTLVLVRVIVNLAFVKLQVQIFPLPCLSLVRCVPLSGASSREGTEWTATVQNFSCPLSILHSQLLHLGKYESLFPKAKYLWEVLRFILFFRTLS